MFRKIKTVLYIAVVNAGILVVLLAMIELFSFAAIGIKGVLNKGDTSDFPPRYREQAYAADVSWVSQYLKDEKLALFDIQNILYLPRTITTPTVNVSASDGARLSCCAESKKKEARKVFVFGGSTLWGVGVKDEFTIPSFLNRVSSPEFKFYNFGIPSYKSTQEILRLETLLMQGHVPDIAIFYDGANDVVTAVMDNEHYDHAYSAEQGLLSQNVGAYLWNIVRLSNTYKIMVSAQSRLAKRATTDPVERAKGYVPTPADRQMIEKAIERYRRNMRHAKMVAQAYGFRAYFFLQPYIATGLETQAGALSDYEKNLYATVDGRHKYFVRTFYEAIRATPGVIDISGVFADSNWKGNYDDIIHLNPLGNRRVAERIYALLESPRSK